MKRYLRPMLLAASAILSLAAIHVNAAVTVNFTKPDAYIDIGFSSWEKDKVMKDLSEHFHKLGAQLPQGQDLKIEVLDIDLAGRIEPRFSTIGYDIRVLRGGVDWPMIQLRYSIESAGKVVKSGEARVADMSYLHNFNRYNAGEPLRYEKRMLDNWFKTVVKE